MKFSEAQLVEMMNAWNYLTVVLHGPEATNIDIIDNTKSFKKLYDSIIKGNK